jgi:hypothetical protein
MGADLCCVANRQPQAAISMAGREVSERVAREVVTHAQNVNLSIIYCYLIRPPDASLEIGTTYKSAKLGTADLIESTNA